MTSIGVVLKHLFLDPRFIVKGGANSLPLDSLRHRSEGECRRTRDSRVPPHCQYSMILRGTKVSEKTKMTRKKREPKREYLETCGGKLGRRQMN